MATAVPNIVGSTVSSAATTLSNQGFTNVTWRYQSNGQTADPRTNGSQTVLSTMPAAGTMVDPHDLLTVKITGP